MMGAVSGGVSRVLEQAAKRGIKGPSARGEWKVCCPFCAKVEGKTDVKFKMGLNPALGVFNCFRCGSGGRADLSWLGKPVVQDEAPAPREPLGPPEGFEPLDSQSLAHRPFIKYLEGRNLMVPALLVGTGVCRHGRYAGRVIVPHFGSRVGYARGQPVPAAWLGFAARSIYPEVKPKYLYPAGMNRAGALWGMHLAYTDTVWLVEGVFDALALHPFAVAAFGKNVTDEQIDLLMSTREETLSLVVCLDGDAWEEAKVLQMRFKLRGAEHVDWCRLPPGTDPGSLGWKVKNYIVGPNGESSEEDS